MGRLSRGKKTSIVLTVFIAAASVATVYLVYPGGKKYFSSSARDVDEVGLVDGVKLAEAVSDEQIAPQKPEVAFDSTGMKIEENAMPNNGDTKISSEQREVKDAGDAEEVLKNENEDSGNAAEAEGVSKEEPAIDAGNVKEAVVGNDNEAKTETAENDGVLRTESDGASKDGMPNEEGSDNVATTDADGVTRVGTSQNDVAVKSTNAENVGGVNANDAVVKSANTDSAGGFSTNDVVVKNANAYAPVSAGAVRPNDVTMKNANVNNGGAVNANDGNEGGVKVVDTQAD